MAYDRTNVIGCILAFVGPVIVAASSDPQFSRWAIILSGVSTGLSGLGLMLARDNRKSDQEAKARVLDDRTGQYVDAIDFSGGDAR